MRSRWLFFVLR